MKTKRDYGTILLAVGVCVAFCGCLSLGAFFGSVARAGVYVQCNLGVGTPEMWPWYHPLTLSGTNSGSNVLGGGSLNGGSSPWLSGYFSPGFSSAGLRASLHNSSSVPTNMNAGIQLLGNSNSFGFGFSERLVAVPDAPGYGELAFTNMDCKLEMYGYLNFYAFTDSPPYHQSESYSPGLFSSASKETFEPSSLSVYYTSSITNGQLVWDVLYFDAYSFCPYCGDADGVTGLVSAVDQTVPYGFGADCIYFNTNRQFWDSVTNELFPLCTVAFMTTNCGFNDLKAGVDFVYNVNWHRLVHATWIGNNPPFYDTNINEFLPDNFITNHYDLFAGDFFVQNPTVCAIDTNTGLVFYLGRIFSPLTIK